MMNDITLKIIFMVFWIGTFMIRFPFDRAQKKNTIKKDQKTPQERLLLGGAFLGLALLPLFYVFSPWVKFADYSLPIGFAYLGILLVPVTLWLFYRSHKDLGANWSPTLEVRDGHSLVTNGVYQYIRHPMYAAIWLWGILQALLLQNYISGLGGIFFFGLLYFLRVPHEEKMMVSEFGDEYHAYIKQTGRLIPKFKNT